MTYGGRLLPEAPNVVAQRNGQAGQTLRLYNSWSTPTNWERVKLGWTSNVFSITAEAGGTGTVRALSVGGIGVSASGVFTPPELATGPTYAFAAGGAGLGSGAGGTGRMTLYTATKPGLYLDGNNNVVQIPQNFKFGFSATNDNASATLGDIYLTHDSAVGAMGFRNGANPMTVNVYNTYTDASNYERLGVTAQTAGDVLIRHQAAGTGTARGLQLGAAGGKLGFNGTTAVVTPTVTGAKGSNAALGSLMTALVAMGLVVDTTSA